MHTCNCLYSCAIVMQAIKNDMRRESAVLQKLESQLASLQYALHPLITMPCPSLITSYPENLTLHCEYAMIVVPASGTAYWEISGLASQCTREQV